MTVSNIRSHIQHKSSRCQSVDVFYPSVQSTTYPLLTYLHGLGGGSEIEPIAYDELFNAITAFGYVLVAPRACDYGCKEDRLSLKRDPPFFGNFYKQHFAAIEWAKNMSSEAPFDMINWDAGVGIAGHSMGGQGTLFASSYDNASNYDIRAAVMHHAYSHEYPAPSIPFLAFTGTKDDTAPPVMAESFFNAPGAYPTRGLVNRENTNHHEPDIESYNDLLPQFTVAWLKLYLNDKNTKDFDFHSMIYGNGTDSLCCGGDGDMKECVIYHQ